MISRNDFRLINTGAKTGSAHIDADFAELAAQRLLPIAQQVGMSHRAMQKVIKDMTRKEFRLYKEGFGGPTSLSQSAKKIAIAIPSMSDAVTIPSRGIFRGALVIEKSVLSTACPTFEHSNH